MTDREAMQQIMQVLGPESNCLCTGCNWEVNDVIQLLRGQGIEYQLRGHNRTMPSHDLEKERQGN